jgi:hypothetical protein
VRLSRLFVLTAFSALTLAGTALATAARGPVEDGTLSVRDGRGSVTLKMKGGVIGRFARGTLTVTDPDGQTEVEVVRGAERSRPINGRTTIYSGSGIRFRISDDQKILIKVAASKTNLSAVGRGDVWLDGRGDPEEGVFFDGSYSLNGEDYKSLPDERAHFDLAAPPPPGN